MLQDIYYSKDTNKEVQRIANCQILPEGTDAVCFQELSGSFQVYVMEKERFEKEYSQGESAELSDLIRFLDADTYVEKIKILESMKEELDDHILNNMAVSLDLSLTDDVDGYSFIMSELKIRSRFEGERGDRR